MLMSDSVSVDKRTLQDALNRQFLGRSMVPGKVFDEVDQGPLTALS